MKPFVFLFVIALNGAISIISVQPKRFSEGLTAKENQFPYMISLQRLSEIQSYTRGHRCGGALISLEHAVTVASCTFDDKNGIISPINPTEYRVFAGSVDLTNDTSADRHRRISFISAHPGFEMSRPYSDDIAVIHLLIPFPENVVTPARITGSSLDFFPGEERCTVARWGAQNVYAFVSTQLMYWQNTIYSQDLCTAFHSNLNYTIDSNMICATTGQPALSGCRGDVGNPLVCGSANDNFLTGLLTITKNCTVSTNPEVYSRVSSYYQWVLVAMTYPPPAPGGAYTLQPGFALLAMFTVFQIYQ